ncbi:uncharacterized protein LOC121366362 [Gigantopelta aegis]|uniref:uncharacterized protein LOC121366362 n=1 Tax=Gigantopelta aegis TaxID=1735272 RepID=UPI001B88833F|nr:uncharacterized protein LOC121366362 [Gigantopelta aegis]
MQYSSNYITDRDTKLTVTCSSGAGTVDVTAAFTSQDSDGNTKEQAISGTADLASDAVDFVIKLKNDSVVSSSTVVPLNDQLTFQFNVNREKAPGGESCKYIQTLGKWAGGLFNKQLFEVTLVDECKNACNNETRCKTIDYIHNDEVCFMYYTDTPSLENQLNFEHYDKDCGSGNFAR